MVIVLATLLVHLLIVTNFYYIPESLAIVILGKSVIFWLFLVRKALFLTHKKRYQKIVCCNGWNEQILSYF